MSTLKKERETLEETASALLSSAIKAGSERAEVCATFTQKTKISFEKQDFQLASSDHGFDFGLRVSTGQKQGFASCNATELDELKETAIRAVEICGFSPENPYQVISGSENIDTQAPDNTLDENLQRVSLQTQKDWAQALVREALKDDRFRMNEGAVEVVSQLFLVSNSKGTHKIAEDCIARWHLMGMGVDGEEITSFDHFDEIARKMMQIPERLMQSVSQFRDRLLLTLQSGQGKTYKGLVIFSPRAVLDILLNSLAYHFNGRNVVESTSKWKLTDVESQVLNEKISLRDLPWQTDRKGWALFDREGTPTVEQTVVEAGKLRGFFLDQYSAEALGLRSTGNAAGGPSSLPVVAPHSLCMDGGVQPLGELLASAFAQQKEILLVHRFSGTINPVTGDFSGVAKGADWLSSGERAYSVKETLISGNFFEALSSGLFGISSEVETTHCSAHSPTLISDGISVTGS